MLTIEIIQYTNTFCCFILGLYCNNAVSEEIVLENILKLQQLLHRGLKDIGHILEAVKLPEKQECATDIVSFN